MPTITTTTHRSHVPKSFRVEQVAGMFDLPLAEQAETTFSAEIPALDELCGSNNQPWRIGAIVGPSGSGKSSIARQAFGDALYTGEDWPRDRAAIDGFSPQLSIQTITGMLTSVGFSSPPAWVRPYRTLSHGERFRCDLARALLQAKELCAFDEFTSVVDRTVAQVGSAAVARAIRQRRVACRFVAVTCHYDVLPWLAPDWVLDMATCQLARGSLRRSPVVLAVVAGRHTAWASFARHHYLGGDVPKVAQCWLALWDDRPVAFCAVVGAYGHRGRKRISRVVVLPDFQGLGIGVKLAETVAEYERRAGVRVNITASHPAILAHCQRSAKWKLVNVSRLGHRGSSLTAQKRARTSAGRGVASFEYVGGG